MKSTLASEHLTEEIFNPFPHFSKREKVSYQINQHAKHLVDFAKFSYLAIVMILLLCTVIELKHIFNVDIFPGVDTPFDNAYYAGKDQFESQSL